MGFKLALLLSHYSAVIGQFSGSLGSERLYYMGLAPKVGEVRTIPYAGLEASGFAQAVILVS